VHHAWTDPDEHARRPFGRIAEHVLLPFAGSIAEADERLGDHLDPGILDTIVGAIPEPWLADARFEGAPAERDAYRRYLSLRLGARATWVAEADRARVEVQRGAVA
jgi:hypothetical protein